MYQLLGYLNCACPCTIMLESNFSPNGKYISAYVIYFVISALWLTNSYVCICSYPFIDQRKEALTYSGIKGTSAKISLPGVF